MSIDVTRTLILVNVLFYVMCVIAYGGNVYSLPKEAVRMYAFHPFYFLFLGEYYRIITAFFIHANVIHLLFNMYALYVLGTIVEAYYGKKTLLALYFIAGICGNIASLIIPVYSLGSSAAIFGLLGLLVMYEKKRYGKLGSIAAMLVVVLVLSNMIAPGQVNNLAHLAGVAVGLLYGRFVKVKSS